MLKLLREDAKTCYYRSAYAEVATAESRVDIFTSPAFRAGLVEHLDTLHRVQPIRHVTLDVFDTIVLRNTKPESRRFWEIAGRVANSIQDTLGLHCNNVSQEDVFVARIMATRASYRTRRPFRNCREGSLADIYKGIVGGLGLSPSLASTLVDVELNYEVENTVKSPLIDTIITFCQHHGIRISMISDMYMSSANIRYILTAHFGSDVELLGKLVSSGDEIITKRSGYLFDLVAEREELKPADFVHIGDSLQGDFKSPIDRGWRAILIPLTNAEVNAIRQDHRVFEQGLADRYLPIRDWIKSGV